MIFIELVKLLENEDNSKFQRMPCMAHTLHLALKDAMKHPRVESTILKARWLVHAVRMPSVANEQMVKRCGKTLIWDCSTRWNSTLDMMKRLLEVKGELNQGLKDLNMDTFLTSDWVKIENLLKLLEPFAVHTDQLLNDSQSLSPVVPCLLNMEAHLLSTVVTLKPGAQLLLRSLRDRFAGTLNSDCSPFDATAAGACLLDPNVSFVLHSPELKYLQKAAESFVQTLAGQSHSTTDENTSGGTETASPVTSALRRYCYLASRLQGSRQGTNAMNSPWSEMTKYMDEIQQGIACENLLDFWRSREAIYPRLAPVALDLVNAPASQAFVERIFCVDFYHQVWEIQLQLLSNNVFSWR